MCLHHIERGKQTAVLKAQKVSFPFSGMHCLDLKKFAMLSVNVLQFPLTKEIKCSEFSCSCKEGLVAEKVDRLEK